MTAYIVQYVTVSIESYFFLVLGSVLNKIFSATTDILSRMIWYNRDSLMAFPWSFNSTIYMMTSSNGNIFRVTGHLCAEFTGPCEFPAQSPVTRSFDAFFDLHPNKRLSKQWWGCWFEALSCPLWRHRNVTEHSGNTGRMYIILNCEARWPALHCFDAIDIFLQMRIPHSEAVFGSGFY